MNYEKLIIAILGDQDRSVFKLNENLKISEDNIFSFSNIENLEKLLSTFKVDVLILDSSYNLTSSQIHNYYRSVQNIIVLADSTQDVEKYKNVDSVFIKPLSPYNFSQHLKSILNLQNTKFKFNLNVLKSIYENSTDGIYVLDENYVIQYINPTILKLTNREEDKLIGEDISTLINHPIGKTFSIYNDYQMEAKLISSDNSKNLVYLTVSVIIEKELIRGYVGIFNNLAEKEKRSEEQTKELQLLLLKEKYHLQQQDMAFRKQLRIIKNDLDHIVENSIFFQIYYKPLDILSGDTYGSAYIGEGNYLLYIIDAMGKGLSASVTSIQSSAFINHAMKKAQEHQDLKFNKLLESYVDFIKDRLLDNEIVSAVFLHIYEKEDSLEIASFGMPPVLVETNEKEIIELKTNNLPIMNFSNEVNIDRYKFSDYTKIMIKSDGLEECQLKNSDKPYNNHILQHFKGTYLLSNIIKKFNSITKANSDDLTTIMLTKLPKYNNGFYVELENDPRKIDSILDQIESNLAEFNIPIKDLIEIKFTLNELILNAIEHGNLGISYEQKQKLLENDIFDSKIASLSKEETIKDKKVKVHFHLINDNNQRLLYFIVEDEGNGFDVTNFFKYINYTETQRFHGRGIIMADSLNNGIFYNKKGSSVSFLKVLEE